MYLCPRPDSGSHGGAPEAPEDEDDDESPERQRVRQRRPSLQRRSDSVPSNSRSLNQCGVVVKHGKHLKVSKKPDALTLAGHLKQNLSWSKSTSYVDSTDSSSGYKQEEKVAVEVKKPKKKTVTTPSLSTFPENFMTSWLECFAVFCQQ